MKHVKATINSRVDESVLRIFVIWSLHYVEDVRGLGVDHFGWLFFFTNMHRPITHELERGAVRMWNLYLILV